MSVFFLFFKKGHPIICILNILSPPPKKIYFMSQMQHVKLAFYLSTKSVNVKALSIALLTICCINVFHLMCPNVRALVMIKSHKSGVKVNCSYHRRSIIRIHTDRSSRGAGDPGDWVQRLTDVDVEVWSFITLVHCLIWKDTIKGKSKSGRMLYPKK